MDRTNDIVAIDQLYAEFCLSAGLLDGARLAKAFSHDGVWTNISVLAGQADVETAGRDALTELLIGALSALDFSHIMIQPRLGRFDGDRVRADCVFREFAKHKGQPVVMFFGRYEDELVKTAEGWRIARRTSFPTGVHTVTGDFVSLRG